jgi:hypothetical protein
MELVTRTLANEKFLYVENVISDAHTKMTHTAFLKLDLAKALGQGAAPTRFLYLWRSWGEILRRFTTAVRY